MKPRIAIYYSVAFGRNDGPPLYWFYAMKNMGLDVTHLAPQGDTSRFGKFDYHVWVDFGEDGLPIDHNWFPPKDGGKTIYVCSDAHIDDKGRDYRYNFATKFDYVFFNQKRFVDEYTLFPKKKEKQNVMFLPHAAEPKVYQNIPTLKKYDVAFIGHIQNTKNYNGFTRIEFLDRMFKAFPNFYFGTRNPQKPEANMFEDAASKFRASKIVLNVSIKDDLNMRLFESLATGSLVLTNKLPTLNELFQNEKHLVTYNTLDEAVERADYYIHHEDERESIAKAGYEEFINKHTYEHRVKEALSLAGYDFNCE